MKIINPYAFAGGGGGFVPTDIAGLERWYEDTGASAATWPDLTATDDAVQATSGSQPSIQAGALNGRQVRRFDGTDDFLHTLAMSGAETTLFVVFNPTSTSVQQILIQWDISGGGAQNRFHFWINGSGKAACYFRDTTNTDMEAVQPGSGATGWQMGAAVFNAAPTFYKDGVAGTPASSNGTLNGSTSQVGIGVKVDSSGNFIVGETNFFGGDIYSILIYNAALSAAELNQLGAYFQARTGITWTPI